MRSDPAAPPPPPPPARPARPSAPPPEVPHALSSRVEGVGCPQCGGTLRVLAGLRVVTCGFCDTAFRVPDADGPRRFAVVARVVGDAARGALRRWWNRGWSKDPRLRREAEPAEAFLCYLPFYRCQADALGFALGVERRRETTGSGKSRRTRTVEVDVERNVQRSFDRTWPGVEVGEWGVRRVLLAGDPLVPFDREALERAGMVFDPTVSPAAVREEARRSFLAASDPAAGLHRVRFRFQELVRERTSLVWYPLWVVRYRFRGRSYQVVIDGEDGSLAYGKAPGNDLYRALALVGSQALTLFIGTSLLRASGDLQALAFVGALVLGGLAWGWRKFRWGGVVEEGSGVGDRSPASPPGNAGRGRSGAGLLAVLPWASGRPDR